MARITVLGAGMMGSALCVPLLDRGHRVQLVGTHLDRQIIERLAQDGVHPGLHHPLPAGARYLQVEQLGEALAETDVVALGVSSAGVRWAGEALAPYLREGTPLLMVSKGLEWAGDRFRLLPDLLKDSLPQQVARSIQPAAITGPCIAGELARRVETCVVLTARPELGAGLRQLAELICTPYYHVQTSTDVVGMEVCAALKNAFAMAVGFGAGLHERAGGAPGSSVARHNYEAAVFAQAACEMAHLVELAGGRGDAAFGLSGIGDLMVTCQGGRTGRFGRWLGTGLSLEQAIERMAGATLECLEILRVVDEALPVLQEQGRVGSQHLPLVRHLCDLVSGRSSLAVPLERFFAGGPTPAGVSNPSAGPGTNALQPPAANP